MEGDIARPDSFSQGVIIPKYPMFGLGVCICKEFAFGGMDL